MSTLYTVTVDDKTVYRGYLYYKAMEFYDKYRNMKCTKCNYSTICIPVKDVVDSNKVGWTADFIKTTHCDLFDGLVEDPSKTFTTDINPNDSQEYVYAKCMNCGILCNPLNVKLLTEYI